MMQYLSSIETAAAAHYFAFALSHPVMLFVALAVIPYLLGRFLVNRH